MPSIRVPKTKKKAEGFCELKCNRREACKKLCKWAEKYVSQDHVYQRELPLPLTHSYDKTGQNLLVDMLDFSRAHPPEGRPSLSPFTLNDLGHLYGDEYHFPFLGTTENRILSLFYGNGMKVKEIAFVMKIRERQVKDIKARSIKKIKANKNHPFFKRKAEERERNKAKRQKLQEKVAKEIGISPAEVEEFIGDEIQEIKDILCGRRRPRSSAYPDKDESEGNK